MLSNQAGYTGSPALDKTKIGLVITEILAIEKDKALGKTKIDQRVTVGRVQEVLKSQLLFKGSKNSNIQGENR